MSVCSICDDAKVVYTNGVPYKCKCVRLGEVREYLTELYANALWVKSKEGVLRYDKKTVCFSSSKPVPFKSNLSIVKTFLVLTECKYSHATYSGGRLVDSMFRHDSGIAMDIAERVDFLVIFLDEDNFRGESTFYDAIVPLLEKRVLYGRFTWVFAKYPLSSSEFLKLYGNQLAHYLISLKSSS